MYTLLTPPAVVFPAVMRFVDALRGNIGLRINAGKSACWGADPGLEDCIWRQLAGVPVGRLDHTTCTGPMAAV